MNRKERFPFSWTTKYPEESCRPLKPVFEWVNLFNPFTSILDRISFRRGNLATIRSWIGEEEGVSAFVPFLL